MWETINSLLLLAGRMACIFSVTGLGVSGRPAAFHTMKTLYAHITRNHFILSDVVFDHIFCFLQPSKLSLWCVSLLFLSNCIWWLSFLKAVIGSDSLLDISRAETVLFKTWCYEYSLLNEFSGNILWNWVLFC